MTFESLHLIPFCIEKSSEARTCNPSEARSQVNTYNNASLFHALILSGSLGRCLNTQSIGFVFQIASLVPGKCGCIKTCTLVFKIFRERSGSVVECLTQDRGAAGSSLTGVTMLWSLSKTHLS